VPKTLPTDELVVVSFFLQLLYHITSISKACIALYQKVQKVKLKGSWTNHRIIQEEARCYLNFACFGGIIIAIINRHVSVFLSRMPRAMTFNLRQESEFFYKILPPFQIIKHFVFSRFMPFAMHLNIHHV
jgi:hypothetical protein